MGLLEPIIHRKTTPKKKTTAKKKKKTTAKKPVKGNQGKTAKERSDISKKGWATRRKNERKKARKR